MTSWTALMAISTTVIAVVVVVFVIALVMMLGRMQALATRMTALLETLDRDGRPALLAAQGAAEDARKVATLLRERVEAFGATTESVRERVERAAAVAEDRFVEFENLFDLLYDEVEDTVLDVAAALRTTRRSASVFRGMKRAFLKRKR